MGSGRKKREGNEKKGMRYFLYHLKKSRTLLLMLLPSVVLIFLFAYMPMVGTVLAFKQYNYRDGIFGSPWVEHIFDNFRFFFISGKLGRVTLNTFLYNVSFIVVNTIFSVGLAVILNEVKNRHLKKLSQSFIFLPYFVSWVIVGSIAYNILNYETGVVNTFLRAIGLEPVNVYATPNA